MSIPKKYNYEHRNNGRDNRAGNNFPRRHVDNTLEDEPKQIEDIINYIMGSEEDPEKVYELFKMEDGEIYWIATGMKDNATTQNQIRKFYDYVIQIDAKNEKEAKIKLAMMMPKIYYVIQRGVINKGNFTRFLQKSIISLNNISGKPFEESFDKFINVFEAIVAYSKKIKGD
jgi:CRISPR type III-A-associated protein Csm2